MWFIIHQKYNNSHREIGGGPILFIENYNSLVAHNDEHIRCEYAMRRKNSSNNEKDKFHLT